MVTPAKIAKADMLQQITMAETKKFPKLIQLIMKKCKKVIYNIAQNQSFVQ